MSKILVENYNLIKSIYMVKYWITNKLHQQTFLPHFAKLNRNVIIYIQKILGDFHSILAYNINFNNYIILMHFIIINALFPL